MKTEKVILVVAILSSILLGGMVIYYPKAESQEEGYDYKRAKRDIEVIAKEPHSTLHHKEALARVRQYIVAELEKLGVNPKISFYRNVTNKKGQSAELHNIYGTIDGKNKDNGSYILLVSHYDSAGTNPQQEEGYSCGAADDGYGVATILEVLREIQMIHQPMVNGIKILFTDGEEMNLLGAREEVQQNPSFFEDVSYAINLEARGTSGPVLLFESSEKNSEVMEFYKNANFPIVTSFVTELYNGSQRSDFYYLRQLGIPGINLSVINDVENYHTAKDCYENIEDASLAHYGNQVLPLVKKFVYSEQYQDKEYFQDGSETIGFTLLPNIVIMYSHQFARIIAAGLLLIVTVLSVRYRKKLVGIVRMFLGLLLEMSIILIMGGGVSFALTRISGVPFAFAHMGKVPGDEILLILLPIVFAVGLYQRERKREARIETSLLFGMIMQDVVLVGMLCSFRGGSYLVMIPLCFSCVFVITRTIVKKEWVRYFALAPIFFMNLLFIPLTRILIMGFSIGALPFILLVVVWMKVVLYPLIKYYLTMQNPIDSYLRS